MPIESSTVRKSSKKKKTANKKIELNLQAAEFVPRIVSRDDGKTSVSFNLFDLRFFVICYYLRSALWYRATAIAVTAPN